MYSIRRLEGMALDEPPLDVLDAIFREFFVKYVRRKGPRKIRIEFRWQLTTRQAQALAGYGIKAKPGQRMVTYQW